MYGNWLGGGLSRGDIQKAVYATYKQLEHDNPGLDKYFMEYYHLKALNNIGIVTNKDSYHPKVISILATIESEFRRLEAKETNKARSKPKPRRR